MSLMCAHGVLICFVNFSENTNYIRSQAEMTRLLMETQCVYYEVTTKLPIIQSVSAHPLCTMGRICVLQIGTGTVFCPGVSPVATIFRIGNEDRRVL